MQRQSGLACSPSDRGPVITNVERTGKEILSVLIIAKEQVLSYFTSTLLVGFFLIVIIACGNLCFHYSSFDIIYRTIMRLLIKNKIRKKENSQNGHS